MNSRANKTPYVRTKGQNQFLHKCNKDNFIFYVRKQRINNNNNNNCIKLRRLRSLYVWNSTSHCSTTRAPPATIKIVAETSFEDLQLPNNNYPGSNLALSSLVHKHTTYYSTALLYCGLYLRKHLKFNIPFLINGSTSNYDTKIKLNLFRSSSISE